MAQDESAPDGASDELTTGARIALALAHRGMSVRALARRLAGEGASPAQVENKRRQIGRWIGDVNEPARSADALAEALGYPADWFAGAKAKQARAQLADRVAQLERQMAGRGGGPLAVETLIEAITAMGGAPAHLRPQLVALADEVEVLARANLLLAERLRSLAESAPGEAERL